MLLSKRVGVFTSTRLLSGVSLEAAYAEAVGPVVAVHVGITAVEVQVAGISTANSRTPIVAVRAGIVERAIAVVAVACGSKP